MPIIVALVCLVGSVIPTAPAYAQTNRASNDEEWCNSEYWNSDREQHCEIREATLDSRTLLEVTGGKNGGIDIRGWDRDQIKVVAKIQTSANSKRRAEEIASAVEIRTRRLIGAEVSSNLARRENASVSFRIYVPFKTNLDLTTHNGGINISEVSGDIGFSAMNGGVTLARLSGDVNGETTNGGLDVELTGDSWNGKGLDVATTNGGITVSVPSGYNAEFETGTVNGRVDLDFPMTVSGRINRNIRTTLGEGGAPVRVRTTNGGVSIRRAS
jgi:DUF4097 and DUF4098 domain-containing protein YvlB